MHEEIGSLRMPDEVVTDARVARQHQRAARVVDPEPERLIHRLVVDYVQLPADQGGDGRSRERNVSAAAKGLKNLAGELGVPVLALVQLNRNRAQRADKRATLPDLRESGDLENTADSVIGLYRDEMDNPSSTRRGLAELLGTAAERPPPTRSKH
jgi:replicative DNA helicase